MGEGAAVQMNEVDGTPNKTNIGANAILAVSLAVSKAGAAARESPLLLLLLLLLLFMLLLLLLLLHCCLRVLVIRLLDVRAGGVPLYKHFADMAGVKKVPALLAPAARAFALLAWAACACHLSSSLLAMYVRCTCMAPHVDVSPHAPQSIVLKGFSLGDWAAAVRDAGALDERYQRRLARRQPPRHAGVHDRCVAQAVLERHVPLLPHLALAALAHVLLSCLARPLLRSAAPAMHVRAEKRAYIHAFDP